MSQSLLAKRWQRLFVKRPRGNPGLLAQLKWHDVVTGLLRPALRRRAGGRFALLMTLPRDGDLAEIGVWRGGFSALLREVCAPRRLLLVDPWSDMAEEAPWSGRSKDLENARQFFEEAYQEVVNRFGANAEVEILRATSVEAARDIADGSLDAVYLDGSHAYEDVREDLRLWSVKLRPGGLLTGDDYYWTNDGGRTFPVRRAVDEYVREMRPRKWAAFRGQFLIFKG